jgi:hypothetical protein
MDINFLIMLHVEPRQRHRDMSPPPQFLEEEKNYTFLFETCF